MRDTRKLKSFVMLAFNSGDQAGDCQQLEDAGLKFRSGRGSYKGVNNPSYLVVFNTRKQFDKILKLALKANQESILVVNENRECSLRYLADDYTQELGQWTEVPRHKAKASVGYSEIDGRYFIAS